jgi:hypothetical protein
VIWPVISMPAGSAGVAGAFMAAPAYWGADASDASGAGKTLHFKLQSSIPHYEYNFAL